MTKRKEVEQEPETGAEEEAGKEVEKIWKKKQNVENGGSEGERRSRK